MPKLTAAQRAHLSKKVVGMPESPAKPKGKNTKAKKLYPGMAVAGDPGKMSSLACMGKC